VEGHSRDHPKPTQSPPDEPPERSKRGFHDEFFVLRGVVSAAALLPAGVLAFFTGRFQIAALCIGLGSWLAWEMYLELRAKDSSD
jgi:hypothetical protein